MFIDEDYEDDTGIIRIRPTPTPTNENLTLESSLRCSDLGLRCARCDGAISAGLAQVNGISAPEESDTVGRQVSDTSSLTQSPFHSPPFEPYKKKCANFEG